MHQCIRDWLGLSLDQLPVIPLHRSPSLLRIWKNLDMFAILEFEQVTDLY